MWAWVEVDNIALSAIDAGTQNNEDIPIFIISFCFLRLLSLFYSLSWFNAFNDYEQILKYLQHTQ